MKRIIALVLAMIMVVFAVAACGNNENTATTTKATTAGATNGTTAGTTAGTTKPTTGTTATTATTQATTTQAPVVIPDPYTAVCFLPKGENAKAINLANQEEVGKLTAADGVELKGGYFYVVNVVPADGTNTAVKEVGAAVETKKVTVGYALVNLKASSYLVKAVSLKNLDLNCFMNTAAFNTAMGDYSTLGKFGTLKITSIDGDMSGFIFDGGDTEELLTDYKWNFVYVGYDATTLEKATGTTWTPLAMSQKEIILTAIDAAFGEENGWGRELWNQATKNYGGLSSVVTLDGKYTGTTKQNFTSGEWQNSLIPVKYADALKKYNELTDDDSTIATNLANAKAATAAAQKALDDAVAANASVKALKDAMDAALATLNEAKQADYDARAAYETAKAAKDTEAQATLKPIYEEAAAKIYTDVNKRTGDGPLVVAYNEAKAAYDAAVAADATLAPLATALTDATAAQKTAQTAQTAVDNYKTYAPLYAKFCEEYCKLANVALWNTADMDNSPIVKAFENVEEDKRLLPTFSYYYDAATDTYTVFVTSAADANMVEKF